MPASARALHCCMSSCPKLGAWRPTRRLGHLFDIFCQMFPSFAYLVCSTTVPSRHVAPLASFQSHRYLPKFQCPLNSLLAQPLPVCLLHTQCPKEAFSPFLPFTIAIFPPIPLRFVLRREEGAEGRSCQVSSLQMTLHLLKCCTSSDTPWPRDFHSPAPGRQRPQPGMFSTTAVSLPPGQAAATTAVCSCT